MYIASSVTGETEGAEGGASYLHDYYIVVFAEISIRMIIWCLGELCSVKGIFGAVNGRIWRVMGKILSIKSNFHTSREVF